MNKTDVGIPLHPAPEDTDLSTSKRNDSQQQTSY